MEKNNLFSKIFIKLFLIILVSFGILFLIFFIYYFWQIKFGELKNINKLNSSFNNNSEIILSEIKNWEKMINDYNPKKGDDNSQIKIITFIDFTCDYSRQDYKKVFNIQNKFPISQIIFKYSPILTNSYKPTLASTCAKEQNSFWEYYDELFKTNDYTEENLYKIASNLSLDLIQFKNCFQNEKYKNEILNDLKDFTDFNIKGTPAYIINGKILKGVATEENWTQIILQNLNN